MKRFIKKLRMRRRLERDLEEEFRFHLEMKRRETGDESAARRQLGNLSLRKEECREMWTFASLETWWQDLRYGYRALVYSPGVTLVAMVALALGIGVNTAVFTIVGGALAFDSGIEKPEDVAQVSLVYAGSNEPIDVEQFLSRVKSMDGLSAYRFLHVNVSDSRGLPERCVGVQMSSTGFAVTGRKPILGRSFNAEDEKPDAPAVVILTHKLWRERYGEDPSVIGESIRVNEVPRVVVGVMPPGMRFPEDTDLWTPLRTSDNLHAGSILFGRLATGVKLAAARSELSALVRHTAQIDPQRFKGLSVEVQPILQVYGVYDSRPLFLAVLCAVGLVLLIACANVANLLLGRAAVRARDISIRIAIGAGRARIIRQLLIESIALSVLGGVLGWALARAGLHWFEISIARFPRPAWLDLSMNLRAFTYLAAISIGSGILFGLAPALRLAQVDVSRTIKSGGHGAAGGRQERRLSTMLVVFEMALCVMLMTGAGLMIRSAVKLYGTPSIANTANVLTARIGLPEAKYSRPEDVLSFHDRLMTRLKSLPGVESAAVTSSLFSAGWVDRSIELEGAPIDDSSLPPHAGTIIVGPEYFRVLQVPPSRGRVFSETDGLTVGSVIVNESFAARTWPGEEALGKRLRIVRGSARQPWLTVVGIVPDLRQNSRRPLETAPLMYLPYAMEPQPTATIIARTQVPPYTLVKALRQEVESMDKNMPIYDVRTLDDYIAQNRLNVGVFGALFTIFAVIALLLASVGLHAVVSHSVGQRTREIGIRMAAGGTQRNIVELVFAQGLRQIVAGLVFGLAGAFVVTRVLRSVLIGVSPTDPVTFAIVVIVLVLAGAIGCIVPARRAVRVDPVVALRCD